MASFTPFFAFATSVLVLPPSQSSTAVKTSSRPTIRRRSVYRASLEPPSDSSRPAPSPTRTPLPQPSSIGSPSSKSHRDPPQPSPRLQAFLGRAEEGDPLMTLSRAEAAFTAIRTASPDGEAVTATPPIVTTASSILPPTPTDGAAHLHFDVVVVGATLGIFYAAALLARGWRVAVVERGVVRGRSQEWNVSREEVAALVEHGVMTREEVEACIVTECEEASRLAFVDGVNGGMREVFVEGVLDCGVAPDLLVECAVRTFKERGGVVFEGLAVEGVVIGGDGVRLTMRGRGKVVLDGALGAGGMGIVAGGGGGGDGDGDVVITARLVVDAMGSASPIARQARAVTKGGKVRPDGVCAVVGSHACANWPSPLRGADVMVSQSPINAQRSTQYFWEAFPVGRDVSARTTYMFCYGECDEGRPSLTDMLEDYIKGVEDYQGVSVEEFTKVKRIFFSFFPSFHRDCPTKVAFDRVVPVGDAGGLQSPLSFGGFGCCLRHLGRIVGGVDEALRGGDTNANEGMYDDALLTKKWLQTLQWYLPSLSVCGLFVKAMSVRNGEQTAGPLLDEYGINNVLWCNMTAMQGAGRGIPQMFLRDVVTVGGLSATIGGMMVGGPGLAVGVVTWVGVEEIARWMGHFMAMVAYAVARPVVMDVRELAVGWGVVGRRERFLLNRMVDVVTFGCGADVKEKQVNE